MLKEPKVGDIWSYWWGEYADLQREYFLITGPLDDDRLRAAVLSLSRGTSDHMLFASEYRGYWRFEA